MYIVKKSKKRFKMRYFGLKICEIVHFLPKLLIFIPLYQKKCLPLHH